MTRVRRAETGSAPTAKVTVWPATVPPAADRATISAGTTSVTMTPAASSLPVFSTTMV
jgi:hypothetical protein